MGVFVWFFIPETKGLLELPFRVPIWLGLFIR